MIVKQMSLQDDSLSVHLVLHVHGARSIPDRSANLPVTL